MAFELELEEKEETGSIEPVEHVGIEFPTRVSFVSVQNGNKIVLAEKMVFDALSSFLYTDLYHGMAVGHIPRRCDSCGRYFLLSSGYDIRYCMSIAPSENDRSCRQVGAHRREKEKIGSDFVRREYSKLYNRLKQRKNRGRILQRGNKSEMRGVLKGSDGAFKPSVPILSQGGAGGRRNRISNKRAAEFSAAFILGGGFFELPLISAFRKGSSAVSRATTYLTTQFGAKRCKMIRFGSPLDIGSQNCVLCWRYFVQICTFCRTEVVLST
jgi:hypothetical protein